MSSIQLSAQVGKQSPDSVKCYTYQELQYIAGSLTELHACDTLLSIAKAKLANRDSLIKEKASEISLLNDQHQIKDEIIILKDKQIVDINLRLETEITRHKWTKLGWGTTTVALGGIIFYLLLR